MIWGNTSNKVLLTNLFWTIMCMFIAVFVFRANKRVALLSHSKRSSWLSSHVNKKYLLNFERQFLNVKEERDVCIQRWRQQKARVILCGSQKQNLYFLLELESVQSLMRVVHQIYVFMIRMQATFNDVKDWTKLTFIFEG